MVFISGGLDDGTENLALARYLASTSTVVVYRRRGRGDSGDTWPFALAREIEDLEAVIAATGGRAHLFGASSGGALALEAVAAGVVVDRDGALRLFMRLAGSSETDAAAAQSAPLWPALRALAPTLRYDAACLGDGFPQRPGWPW